MTGKFTENVHGLGFATGRAIHRLVLSATSPPSASDAGSHSCLSNITSSIGVDSLHLSAVPSAASSLARLVLALPDRYRRWWWDLLRTDPLHVLVETLLIVMCVALVMMQRRAERRFGQERKKGAPTEEEVEELLREWKEERRRPLGRGAGGAIGSGGTRRGRRRADAGNHGLVVERVEGSRLYFDTGDETGKADAPGGAAEAGGAAAAVGPTPASALNFATLDYLSSASSPALRRVARSALEHYGCGSCGPRGFYGTIDAHLEAEEAVSSWLGTEGAILYSDGASAATSTVAAFAKRGDLLIVDEGVSEALLVGVTLSRANVRYFRHNDVRDLRRVLEKVAAQDISLKRKPADQRRFLVIEGLYRNWGTVAPIREIVALKEEFRYRLILDDSHAIGALGAHGRGSLEHAGLKPMVHAEIVTFGLEHALGSVGGMTVGSEEVVDHQRLSGAGYCFSASAPPFLSRVCVAAIRKLEGRIDEAGGCLGKEEDAESGRGDGKSKVAAEAGNAPQRPSIDELAGTALMSRLHENIATLYTTLTDASHPHALKLRHRLSITSDPLSPLLYLRLADEEATGRTRAEQTAILDRIARHCLVKGGVAIVSTGGHVRKYLQLVPEPSLRITARAGQTGEEVEALVRALGEGVESVLVRNDGGVME